MKRKIYIASPYTYGDQVRNVKLQMDAFNILINHNYTPFIPLLSHFQHMVHPRTESEWLEWDLDWLKTCDIVLRLKPLDKNGKEIPSSGADLEVQTAIDNNILVWTVQDITELENLLSKKS